MERLIARLVPILPCVSCEQYLILLSTSTKPMMARKYLQKIRSSVYLIHALGIVLTASKPLLRVINWLIGIQDYCVFLNGIPDMIRKCGRIIFCWFFLL